MSTAAAAAANQAKTRRIAVLGARAVGKKSFKKRASLIKQRGTNKCCAF
jgi:hypothetical protein